METIRIKYYIYLLLNLVVLAISCKKGDWYDVKSDKNLAVPTTLKDMQALMDNARVMNTSMPSRGEIASDGHYIDEIQALTLEGYDRNAYIWTKELPFRYVPDWAGLSDGSYIRVYYANLVLDGLQKIEVSNLSELDDIKGQALFHRAHAFYELAQVFAPPFEVNNARSKLGIPLRLESDINIPSTRSTVSQTYDQIIKDLIMAKDLLPTNSLHKTRPSKIAVLALLARINLSMENYEQAGVYANLCLDSYAKLIDYKTLDTTGTTNKISVYNPEMIFFSTLCGTTPLYFGYILVDRPLYDSYSNNDLRKKIFYNYDTISELVIYKGTYAGMGFDYCFSGLATDEVYLIRAECYARAGKVLEAVTDLNTLLRTRWQPKLTPTDIEKPYVDITATDKDDALRKVLEERKKELILRGTRWSDLRRLNRDSRFAITLTRTVGGKTYTLEPNSYKYTFPIPDDIIEQTGIPQNPGW